MSYNFLSQGASDSAAKLVTGATKRSYVLKFPKIRLCRVFAKMIKVANAPRLTQENYVEPWGDHGVNPTAFDDPNGPFGSKALTTYNVQQATSMPGVHNQQCLPGENPVNKLFTTPNQPVGPMTTTTTGGTGSSNIPQLGWDGYSQPNNFQQNQLGYYHSMQH
jgi:hypothetical protein